TAGLAAPVDVTATVHIRDSIAADRVSTVFRGLAAGLPIGLWEGLLGYMSSGHEGGLTSGLGIGLLVGLGFALGLSVNTASRRWLIRVGFWLPVTGRLPWRVVGFLDDAHRRGVLRQVGAVYQFRHARLQDYLAADRSSKDALA